MKGLLNAIFAGALLWAGIIMFALGYEPAHARSIIAHELSQNGHALGKIVLRAKED
jgi:hypothetical protein